MIFDAKVTFCILRIRISIGTYFWYQYNSINKVSKLQSSNLVVKSAEKKSNQDKRLNLN